MRCVLLIDRPLLEDARRPERVWQVRVLVCPMHALPVDMLTGKELGGCAVALDTLGAICRAMLTAFANRAQVLDPMATWWSDYHSAGAIALRSAEAPATESRSPGQLPRMRSVARGDLEVDGILRRSPPRHRFCLDENRCAVRRRVMSTQRIGRWGHRDGGRRG